ncbi:hypothetical protein ACOME3_008137 [Neoechinorhynchus agilis]
MEQCGAGAKGAQSGCPATTFTVLGEQSRPGTINSSIKVTASFGNNELRITRYEDYNETMHGTRHQSIVKIRHEYSVQVPTIKLDNASLIINEENVTIIVDCKHFFTYKLPKNLWKTDVVGGSGIRVFNKLNSGAAPKMEPNTPCEVGFECNGTVSENSGNPNDKGEMLAIGKRIDRIEQGLSDTSNAGIVARDALDKKISSVLEAVYRMSYAFDKIIDEFQGLNITNYSINDEVGGKTNKEPKQSKREQDYIEDEPVFVQYPKIANCTVDINQYFKSLRLVRAHNVANAEHVVSTVIPVDLTVVSQGESELLTLMRDGEITGFRVFATKPGNIAHDHEGRFYIGDFKKGWIATLDSNLRVVKYLPQRLQRPLGIGISGNRLYVSQYGRQYLHVITTAGRFITNITVKDVDIADVFIRGSVVYVSAKRGIHRFDLDGHAFDGAWNDGLVKPRDLYVDDTERLWVMDEFTRQLVVMSTYDGDVIDRLDLSDITKAPTGFALDANCTMYVADKIKGKVLVFKPSVNI